MCLMSVLDTPDLLTLDFSVVCMYFSLLSAHLELELIQKTVTCTSYDPYGKKTELCKAESNRHHKKYH